MKWVTNALSLGLVATSVLAAPLDNRQDDGGLDLYQLQVTSKNKQIDGRYLALNGSDLGLYDGDDTGPIKVYQTDSKKEGCKELHTYPIGIVDHSLGLVGPPALLTFVDMVNPDGADPGNGAVAMWDTFRVEDGKVTNDAEGQWLAFPDVKKSWKVKWSDGSSPTIDDYMPVEVAYVSAGQGRYVGK
ncbi:Uu.00g121120.m01.CDS01 [Anthostomella pinea]|uniref:Uu.00g121120.m01.CDS01 n=1 Tax=Anthostomella pinea TaxID=933095 RepID=A0AAI8VGV5_9PEZI|nr:Uu.00g121120.m01.CDS01 [Anthostomella pinea]